MVSIRSTKRIRICSIRNISRSPSLQSILLVCVVTSRVGVIYVLPAGVSSSYTHVLVSFSPSFRLTHALFFFFSFIPVSIHLSIPLAPNHPSVHLAFTKHRLSARHFVKYWTDKNKRIHSRVPMFSTLGIKWWTAKQTTTSDWQLHKSSCTCGILMGWPWRHRFPVSDRNYFGFPLLIQSRA